MKLGSRIHTVRITGEAVEHMIERYGALRASEMVREMVIDAGLGQADCVWHSAPGCGLTVRGLVNHEQTEMR